MFLQYPVSQEDEEGEFIPYPHALRSSPIINIKIATAFHRSHRVQGICGFKLWLAYEKFIPTIVVKKGDEFTPVHLFLP